MKDIQVFTALDAKTVAAEKLDILLLSTEGAADMATYNDLEKLKAAFPRKKVAAMADKMFNQDNTHCRHAYPQGACGWHRKSSECGRHCVPH